MKTMIVVRGAENTGKTSSIRKVYDIIDKLASYKSLGIEKKHYCSDENGDIVAVFKYKEKIIGIDSWGDPGSEYLERLEQLAYCYKCDIIVCASRLGGTVHSNVLDIKEKYDYNFYWVVSQMIRVKGDELFDSWNESIARGIIKLIDELI